MRAAFPSWRSKTTQPPLSVLVGLDYKDRRTGLILFGILAIFIGFVCALFVPMLFLGQALAGRAAGEVADYRMAAPGALTYGLMAAGFVWLGIGSIMARRWARALLLILAWTWLLLGVFTTALTGIFLPQMLAASQPGAEPLPDAARLVISAVVLAFTAVVMVVLPAAFVLFYRSRHVRATCEARDPVTRWTDRCPLPVLALSLGLAFAPFSLVTMLVAYGAVVPLFGRVLTGGLAVLLIVSMMAVWGYAAWATYKLKPIGWWVVTASFVFFSVSSVVTFARVDIAELYRAMGYTPVQVELVRRYPFMHGPTFTILIAAIMAPFIAYLLWMKRYFRQG